HPKDRKRHAVVEANGKNAVTHYAVKDFSEGVAWLKVRLETGRTHQIRVHCLHLGCAILGDPVYGWNSRDKEVEGCPGRQMLHAARLAFAHPITGKKLAFERPPPEDMAGLMRRLNMKNEAG
ncbi:MAG: pseudouridine synthase, partial [Kiritimatiellaeota bacterium]|nr:pseudouridine synthase [Kiritimatiellota bacterium]